MNEIELTGKVILRKFGKNTKSEHDAIYLQTGSNSFRLKKKDGNPFYDESLHQLIGHIIKVKGRITPYFFEISGEPEKM